jgi:hypothetical protein
VHQDRHYGIRVVAADHEMTRDGRTARIRLRGGGWGQRHRGHGKYRRQAQQVSKAHRLPSGSSILRSTTRYSYPAKLTDRTMPADRSVNGRSAG